jgi:protein gp37
MSKIEWTDHTFNPWWGCTKVHAGCKNCYAETLDHRWGGNHWGPNAPRRMVLGEWGKPAKWNRDAEKAGKRARVFCASMADLFERYNPVEPVVDQQGKPIVIPRDFVVQYGNFGGPGTTWTVPALRARVFDIIAETPWLDWLLLTKRPENVKKMVPTGWFTKWPENVMIGTSPCDQATADKCIPELLQITGRRFLSMEPLIGPVHLPEWWKPVYKNEHYQGWEVPGHKGVRTHGGLDDCIGVDWVIVGGESGPGARPCNVEWVRSIVEQCKAAGVPCFVKQLGAFAVGEPGTDYVRTEINGLVEYAHRSHLPFVFKPERNLNETLRFKFTDSKGGNPDEWPEDLRVREFPREGRAGA